jgi:DNA-binding NtrC family response regulator
MKDRILVVDDAPTNVDLLADLLEPEGYEVLAAATGEQALALCAHVAPALVLLDVVMPGMDGFETCRRLCAQANQPAPPIVFITGRGDTASVIEGFRAGGVAYITKPFHREEVLARVRAHAAVHRLTQDLRAQAVELQVANQQLRAEIARREQAERNLDTVGQHLALLSEKESARWGLSGFVGESPTVARVLQDLQRLRDFPTMGVLITGESGTGKELIARAIHAGSPRSKAPLIAINCSAVPGELAESLFFGHRPGAFSGAARGRKGYFELAHGGTLFLDEVGDMPLPLQAKLLRVLEYGTFLPLGGEKEVHVDVRVVAATNVDLQKKVHAGDFRADLFYRLARFAVPLPPLRERRADVPLLAAHFLALFAGEMRRPAPRLGTAALEALGRYGFPGNVRELKNLMERALIEAGVEAEIRPQHLGLPDGVAIAETTVIAARPGGATAATATAGDLPFNLEQAELALIRRALHHARGNVAQAARLLGVPRMRLYRRLGSELRDEASEQTSEAPPVR